MKGSQRARHFSAALTPYLSRAEVSDTELARRMGVNRLTIRRWRQGETLPSATSIRALRTALRWTEGPGVVRDLSDEELERLLTAAGYHAKATWQEPDRIASTDRCRVYTHRYAPDVFPAKWSSRIIELERGTAGSIYTMWGSLPSITRGPEFYAAGYRDDLYERELVEAYMAEHAGRREAFLRRLETSEVHHLYSVQGTRNFLSGASAIDSPLWKWWQTPRAVIERQFDDILSWLREYPNFELRLRPNVPANVIIIGLETVLVEFTHTSRTMSTDNVTGLEIVGSDAALQFIKQFRSFWADEETIKDRREVVQNLGQLRDEYLRARRAA